MCELEVPFIATTSGKTCIGFAIVALGLCACFLFCGFPWGGFRWTMETSDLSEPCYCWPETCFCVTPPSPEVLPGVKLSQVLGGNNCAFRVNNYALGGNTVSRTLVRVPCVSNKLYSSPGPEPCSCRAWHPQIAVGRTPTNDPAETDSVRASRPFRCFRE